MNVSELKVWINQLSDTDEVEVIKNDVSQPVSNAGIFTEDGEQKLTLFLD